MCWTSFKSPVRRIAEQDITCYKVIFVAENKVISYYQEYEYEFEKLYTTEISNVAENGYVFIIIQGFHSYEHCPKINSEGIESENGTVYKFYNMDTIDTVRCIIPKGSEYYINENGEIVSNAIIIMNNGRINM